MASDDWGSYTRFLLEIGLLAGLLVIFGFMVVMGILACLLNDLVGVIWILIGTPFAVICGRAIKNHWSIWSEEQAAKRESLPSYSWTQGVIVFLTTCFFLIAVYALFPQSSLHNQFRLITVSVVAIIMFTYWVYGKIRWERKQRQKAHNI
jgi:hypothetical protein